MAFDEVLACFMIRSLHIQPTTLENKNNKKVDKEVIFRHQDIDFWNPWAILHKNTLHYISKPPEYHVTFTHLICQHKGADKKVNGAKT